MSLEKDITEINRMVEGTYNTETETMPTTAPVITPQTPTPRREKPTTPIKQVPGVTPKPKAMINKDAELFLRKRNLLGSEENTVVEARPGKKYDLGVVPADKLKWLNTGDETLNKILPGLPQEQRDYLLKISSDSYTELVDRLEDLTGITVTQNNLPKLAGITVAALKEVTAIESRNKIAFEDLAMELVFSIPEFKIVEQAYLNDEISIDAKIAPAELTKLTQPEEPEEQELEGLTNDEELNFKMADFLENNSDEDIRRRFSNLMTSGGAIGKLNLFHMVAERLKRMDPRLPELYSLLSSVVYLGYWVMPSGVEKMAASSAARSAGSEEVIPEGDKYVIRARGIIFPYLVHELVKGIYEYLALNPNQQFAMKKDKVEDETRDFMAGPGIHKTVLSYVPDDKQELIPIVQKKLTAMGPAEIRDVLAKNPKGQQIMQGLITQADKEWSGYKKSKEDYERPV